MHGSDIITELLVRASIHSGRHQLGRDVITRLVTALVLSRLDCNASLAGLRASTLAQLCRAVYINPCDHITTGLQQCNVPVETSQDISVILVADCAAQTNTVQTVFVVHKTFMLQALKTS